MIKLFVCILGLYVLATIDVFAQHLLKNNTVIDQKFKTLLEAFVNENKMTGKESGVPILVILQRNAGKTEAVLSMIAKMSEFEQNLPTNYLYIDNLLLLLYDGSEQIFEKEKAWYNDIRGLVTPKLCNDVQVKMPSNEHREVAIPCTFKYDPQQKRLVFVEKKLVEVTPYFGDILRD